MQVTAWAVLGKDGAIRKHSLHGHYAIYAKKGDADTSTMIGKVVPVTINIEGL